MLGSNADHLSIFLMGLIDSHKATAATGLQKQPEVGEGRQTGGGNITQAPFLKVRDQVIGSGNGEKEVRSESVDKHGG